MIATTDTIIVHRIRVDRSGFRAIDRALARLRRALDRADAAPWVDLGGEGG